MAWRDGCDTLGEWLALVARNKARVTVMQLDVEDIKTEMRREARRKARSDDAYKSALRLANRLRAALGVRGAARSSASRSPARSGYVPVHHGAGGTSFMRADVGYSHKAINVPSLDRRGR